MTIFDPRLAPKAKMAGGLTPVPLPKFGGLRLDVDPQELGWDGAIDLLNIDLLPAGRVRGRDGYSEFTATALANRPTRLFAAHLPVGLTARLFGLADTTVYAIDSTGATTHTSAALAETCRNMVVFGTASAEKAYGPVGTSTTTIMAWTAAGGFTYPATGYAGVWAAVQPNDNRLVLVSARDASHSSRVRFSAAGDAETFAANDFVDLAPNDGTVITGVARYGDLLFVFKQNKFAVFYGNNTDSAGDTEFNYRWVDTGVGIPAFRAAGCCTGPDGVYFLGQDGIYRTSGGPPQKMTTALDPLFKGVTPNHYNGSPLSNTLVSVTQDPSLAWFNGRLFCSLKTASISTNDAVFVWDPDAGWTVWDVPAAALTVWGEGAFATNPTLYFSYATGANKIAKFDTSATDAGTAIVSRYRTGFADLGTPGTEKVMREILLDGYGAPTVKVAVNDGALDTGAAVTLGTSPTVAQGRRRAAYRGRNFSVQMGASSAWSVSRAVAHMRSERPSGLRAA